jgi:hypothetical protein
MNLLCSPSHERYKKGAHKTCFSKTQLINICNNLKIPYKSSSTKDELWNLINNQMFTKYSCPKANEHCWVDTLNLYNSVSHRPKKPESWKENKYTWLTNFDLMNVMLQYEKKYRSFKFIGVFPIDFDQCNNYNTFSKELCNIDIMKFKQYQFGIIFNLDKHNEPGSHWVCVYINTNSKSNNFGFFYFDSNALPMPSEINTLSKSIQTQVNDSKFKILQNDKRKQFKNTECGMFCMHFIIQCLKKHKFKEIISQNCFDDDIHKLRQKYFR